MSKRVPSYTQEFNTDMLNTAWFIILIWLGLNSDLFPVELTRLNQWHKHAHTSLKPDVSIKRHHYNSLGSNLHFFSHFCHSFFHSVDMLIDYIIHNYTTALYSCLYVLITICAPSIHQFSCSFTYCLTEIHFFPLWHALIFKSQKLPRNESQKSKTHSSLIHLISHSQLFIYFHCILIYQTLFQFHFWMCCRSILLRSFCLLFHKSHSQTNRKVFFVLSLQAASPAVERPAGVERPQGKHAFSDRSVCLCDCRSSYAFSALVHGVCNSKFIHIHVYGFSCACLCPTFPSLKLYSNPDQGFSKYSECKEVPSLAQYKGLPKPGQCHTHAQTCRRPYASGL